MPAQWIPMKFRKGLDDIESGRAVKLLHNSESGSSECSDAPSVESFCVGEDYDYGGRITLCDRIRAFRMKIGLRCIGCIPDPFSYLSYVGVDLTSFYFPVCKILCSIAGVMVAFVVIVCVRRYSTVFWNFCIPLLPWVVILSCVGGYFGLLGWSTYAGVRVIMTSVIGRNPKDFDRPRRVLAAYRATGNFETDMSVLTDNAKSFIEMLLKDNRALVREAIQEGFNTDFLERVRGDNVSNGCLCAACVLSFDELKSDTVYVYTDSQRRYVICTKDQLPDDASDVMSLGKALEGTGEKKDFALSITLEQRETGIAKFLAWALGTGIASVQNRVAALFNQVDEMSVFRLLATMEPSERQKIVAEYDAMHSLNGSFREHVHKKRMNADFRQALLELLDDVSIFHAEELSEKLLDALATSNKTAIICALCHASEAAIDSLSTEIKERVHFFFDDIESKKRHPIRSRLSSRGLFSALTGELENLGLKTAAAVEAVATDTLTKASHTVEHAGDSLRDPSITHLVDILLTSGRGVSGFSDRYVQAVECCVEEGDFMGLVGLLLHLDSQSRLNLRRDYGRRCASSHADVEDPVGDDGVSIALARDICMNYKIEDAVITVGMIMPSYWTYALAIYYAFFGGFLGLGTDEASLMKVLVLNWHQRPALREAFVEICKWHGKPYSLEEIIKSEIESEQLCMMLQHFVVEA
eukprot:TRINITY_DN74325_c0_g1_i1.p1 TRINITY_DN74325_c0_g1~~TRINITY_DN74325_c0_g1_i1.p1  ORF type:complete len:725 (-),score=96.14 TRINITY_DN74325_c0_g1_i1:242-2332(-)